MKLNRISKEILRFYSELERLEERYDELSDTDVREALHLTLNCYFVWGEPNRDFPRTYGMFTKSGDRAIASAVGRFLTNVNHLGELASIPLGQARLDLLQDRSLKTAGGAQYDEFIGHVGAPLAHTALPAEMFEPGEYDDDAE